MRPDYHHSRLAWTFPIALLAITLILNGCSGSGGKRDRDDSDNDVGASATFPVPTEIKGNVDFWRHVYGVWSRGEVAIHDDEHMGVIYEVAKIPGAIQAGYSASQKDWLDGRLSDYTSALRGLEERIRSRQTLTSRDKDLLEKFENSGGKVAVYGAADRLRAQRGLRERFRRSLEVSGRYDQTFREIMQSHNVPADLAYLPHVESSFQMNAKSSVGASGVWQFMPATGRIYMTVNDNIDERYDPILAADGAARYLSQAYRRLKSWPLAITSYNHGQGGMAKAKAQHGDQIGKIVKNYNGKAFGFASRNYYAEFIAAREVAHNAQRYFPEGVNYERPWPYDRLVLAHTMPATNLARYYGTSTAQLADLNLHWRDAVREGRANLPAGSTIWLPEGSIRRVGSQPPPVSASLLARNPSPPKPTTPRVAAVANTQSLKEQSTAPARMVATKVIPKTRYHVVQPQETLYRVAAINGLSVSELRRLNQMGADDNNIQPGQKLKVGI
ncbi:lytic transglycosylase domain-containing protein [Chromatium okenii]|uniref:lytic transglycosylase domain-containing protein n=1 Tax=Chromatium okenii TaxID=61644 RepID=UPI0026EADE05|nr:transglycosylase SLT domain-containing protein [Chromatium okenii]MBV5309894.1 transglycosylase SLT domain-containing protein [Chromatium okenii]